jgi:hypothetical protein
MATNALREVLRAAESLQDLDFDYPTANYFGPSTKLEDFLDAAADEDAEAEEPLKVVLPRALREVTVP